VRDEIINLGSFWDSCTLSDQSKIIKPLCESKALCFSRTYRCLSAAKSAALAIDMTVRPALLLEKLSGASKRALRDIPDGYNYTENTVALNSYGMKGRVKFDTLKDIAKEYISVSDDYGTAHLFFAELIAETKRKRLSITVSKDPLNPDKIDALRIDCINRVYETGEGGDRHINMHRFLDHGQIKSTRNELKELNKLKESAEVAALRALSSAAKYHFTLEEIYGKAMDFSAKEKYCKEFIQKLFK
jgi:hypothetical protein